MCRPASGKRRYDYKGVLRHSPRKTLKGNDEIKSGGLVLFIETNQKKHLSYLKFKYYVVSLLVSAKILDNHANFA